MELSEAQRGMLKTKMADEVIASIFEKSVAWVKRAREQLAREQQEDVARWNKIGGTPLVPPPRPKSGPKPKPHTELSEEIGKLPSVAPPVPASQEFPPAPQANEPEQIDLEQAIAAQRKSERLGAPDDLDGRELAAWLYDHTEATFEQIGLLSGLDADDVKRIADGDDGAEEAPAPLTPSPPAPAEIVIRPRQLGKSAMTRAAIQAAEQSGQKIIVPERQTAEASAPPAGAASPGAPTMFIPPKPKAPAPEEIPSQVLKWCRWFLTARWRLIEVADLFDLEPADLRQALGLEPPLTESARRA